MTSDWKSHWHWVKICWHHGQEDWMWHFFMALWRTTWTSGLCSKDMIFIVILDLVTHPLLVMHGRTLFMVISCHTLGSELSLYHVEQIQCASENVFTLVPGHWDSLHLSACSHKTPTLFPEIVLFQNHVVLLFGWEIFAFQWMGGTLNNCVMDSVEGYAVVIYSTSKS